MERMTIRWITADQEAIAAISRRFNIPSYSTLNGYIPVEIPDEEMNVFMECNRRLFFAILPLKWCKNGGHYIFKTCQ